MGRRTIELPDYFHFSTNYTVLFSDINAANHMGADRVLPIATEAQLRFIKSLGYEDAVEFDDAGLIMVHSEIEYKSEAHHYNELTINLAVTEVGNKNLEFIYHIFNNSTNRETARLRVSMLFFDYNNKVVIEVPEELKAKLASIR